MNKQEILDGISKLMDGDRSVFMNTHEAFRELNTLVLGESQALLTDNILERYDNEEYYDRENVLTDVSSFDKIQDLPAECFGKLDKPDYFYLETDGYDDKTLVELYKDKAVLYTEQTGERETVELSLLIDDFDNILSFLEQNYWRINNSGI